VVLERLELLLHRVDDRVPRRLGERDGVRALIIRELRAPRDLRVHTLGAFAGPLLAVALMVADEAPASLRATAFGVLNFASGIALLLASLIGRGAANRTQ
jgi:hypothetical protein